MTSPQPEATSTWKSCLFDCTALHQRSEPIRYGFKNRLFEFYLDLDELETMDQHCPGVTYNRPGVFAFYDDDHFPGYDGPIKERVRRFLADNNVVLGDGKVFLLCHLRTFGYVFNPVSFYFCETADGTPLCAIAEVENTFYEVKPFFVPYTPLNEAGYDFTGTAQKWFYVSPFSQLDLAFDLRLKRPSETLELHVHSIRWSDATTDRGSSSPSRPILISWLKGQRLPLSGKSLCRMSLKHPFMTLKIITLIHWHAMWLALKKVPFARKEANPSQQRQVLRPHKSLHQHPASTKTRRDPSAL